MNESLLYFSFFFFNDTATTEIYTLSLHDALPICEARPVKWNRARPVKWNRARPLTTHSKVSPQSVDSSTRPKRMQDRKSTRLNSSHSQISYAVFCLKKKKNYTINSKLINILQ